MASSIFNSPILFLLLVSFLVIGEAAPLVVPPAPKMPLEGLGHFMLPKKGSNSLNYNPIPRPSGGNSVSIPGIGGTRSYIPGGDDTLVARWSTSPVRPIQAGPKKNPRSPGGDTVSTASRSYIDPRGGDDALAASKMSLDGRRFNPIGVSPAGTAVSTASRSFAGSLGGNTVSIPASRRYIPSGGDDTLAVSYKSLEGTVTGLGQFMFPTKSLDNNPVAGSPGGKAVGIGGSRGSRSFVGTLGGTASRSYIPAPSPPPPSVHVVESEPPSKPRPPTCLPNCKAKHHKLK